MEDKNNWLVGSESTPSVFPWNGIMCRQSVACSWSPLLADHSRTAAYAYNQRFESKHIYWQALTISQRLRNLQIYHESSFSEYVVGIFHSNLKLQDYVSSWHRKKF